MILIHIIFLLGLAILNYSILNKQDFSRSLKNNIEKNLANDSFRTILLSILLLGSLISIIFLWDSFFTTANTLNNINFYRRLIPWAALIGVGSIQTAIYLFQRDSPGWKAYIKKHGVAFILLILILLAGGFMHSYLWELPTEQWDKYDSFNTDGKFILENQDISVLFKEGISLHEGKNPYARVKLLEEDFQWNHKNATYFPIFFYLTWLTQRLGLGDIFYWLVFWRVVFLVANLGIAALLFMVIYHRFDNRALAIFAVLFWLFNRWTLHITMIYHIEFIAIFFFLLSLSLWSKNQVLSLLSFGLSLGIKQIAIFMVPIYIIWIWQKTGTKNLKQFWILILALGSIPLLSSLPFLIWDMESFIRSVFLSATRIAESHFGIPAIDALLELSGLPAKLPMLGLMALVYYATWLKKIGPFVTGLLIMVVFVDFNSVLFRQYMAWVVPLVPLAVVEYKVFRSD
ncbi:MAG: hypothetical protein HOF10_01690 [Chloroflexi bacterium]|nr:hypothetical protein [Chloroflexota bacterium]MBT4683050.1 hypothetical protein [Chloroflexota bacterium]MBT7216763.1 hypothetical protein [Chloroflexota bacterium]MBT7820056.1 hypothetical protein [Chloroflexota bacterium]